MVGSEPTTADTPNAGTSDAPHDYTTVETPARVACYDDPKAAPRIIEIPPNSTAEFIESLAQTVYEQSRALGGRIAYTAIREVTENFIHAQFAEVVVSILDAGNTIRFADQGPGIAQKEQAMRPGFTSATEPMKRYIRGVGSGFPLTSEYLEASHGTITIEDNLTSGAVITLSLVPHTRASHETRQDLPAQATSLVPPLAEREKRFIALLSNQGPLGVTELSRAAGTAASTTHTTLSKLEREGIVETLADKKRSLTNFGYSVANELAM